MAIEKLDLGIQNTEEIDAATAANAFLSGEEIEPLEKKKKAVAPAKKVSVKKPEEEEEEEEPEDPEEEDAANAFLEGEEEEEPEEDDNPLEKKKKAAEQKKQQQQEEDEEEPDGEEQTNQFEVLSRELLQLGIFTQEDENEELPATPDAFAERWAAEKQKGATQWLDAFLRKNGEDRMDLFEAIYVNGMDPREYLPAYNEILDLEEMDMTSETNQERVFREYYRKQNFPPEKIEAKLQKSKDYGDLADDSAEFHQQLLAKRKEELEGKVAEREAEVKRKQDAEQNYRASVNKVLIDGIKSKEIKGVPITEKKAQEVADFLVTPKYKTPSGELLTEFDKFVLDSRKPENVELRTLIALLHLSGWDFSKIEKRGVTKETNQLFSSLKKTSVKTKHQKVETPDPWAHL